MNRRSFLSFFGIAPALVLPKAALEPVKAVALVRYNLGTFKGPRGEEITLWDTRLRMSNGEEHEKFVLPFPRDALPFIDGGRREPTEKQLEELARLQKQARRDGAWVDSAQLRNVLDEAFDELLNFSLVDGGETWGLRVYTQDREIFLASETTTEDAVVAVRLMLEGGPGVYTPQYVGGRVQGVSSEPVR